MSNETTWDAWVERITGGASARAIASRIDGAPTTVARWSREGQPSAAGAIAVARAYDANAIDALRAAGHVNDDDISAVATSSSIRKGGSIDLIEELKLRALNGQLDASAQTVLDGALSLVQELMRRALTGQLETTTREGREA